VENPLLNGKVVMLEVNPNFVNKHEVLVPKILFGLESGNVPVRYLNLSDQSVKLFKGTKVATIEDITQTVQSISTQSTDSENVNVVSTNNREVSQTNVYAYLYV
jgi:hypothetical protein